MESAARVWTVVLWLVLAGGLPAVDLTRIVTSDEPIAGVDRRLLEEAFGARVFVIPADGLPPVAPRRVAGIVLHDDPEGEPAWIVGDRNPQIDFVRLKQDLARDFPGIRDVEDKWDEYNFLMKVAPDVAPPPMGLASSFGHGEPEAAVLPEVRGLARAAMGRHGLSARAVEGAIVRLETLRRAMHAALGRAIVKCRDCNHSEGRLPKTSDDWPELYAGYVAGTKAVLARLERELAGTSESLEERMLKLPFIEGRILEMVLSDPDNVVVQSMVKIAKEVRAHIAQGDVIEGATFLRFYPVGQYLTSGEISAVESAIRHKIVARLPGRYRSLPFTPDLILEAGTGRVRVLDMNGGIYSGYYYPQEDLFTTNLLAERLRGERTPLLREWDAIRESSPGPPRVALIRAFLKKYEPFMRGDVLEAFWDRVLRHQIDTLGEDPTGPRLLACLEDLRAAGLKTASIYHQLLGEVQATWPSITLGPPALARWSAYLERLDPEIRAVVAAGHLGAVEAPRPKPKKRPQKGPRRRSRGRGVVPPTGR